MRVRHDDDDGASLDSLLDTMTNVVGILVIVLVVTQLGVGEAVQRITSADRVKPEALQAAELRRLELDSEQDRLQAELDAIRPLDARQFQERLQQTQSQIAQQQVALADYRNQQQRNLQAEKQARQRAQSAREEIEENEQQREKVERELKQALAELQRLEAILDKTPPRRQLPPKVVNLPNPRPAPKDAQAIVFVCAKNSVYPLNLDAFRDAAQKRAAYVIRANALNRNPAAGINPENFVKLFNERPLKDDYFSAEMIAAGGRYPQLVFTPRPNDGASSREVESRTARFQRNLQRIDKQKYYGRFVLPDSYDVYVAARHVVSEHGLAAGWEPQSDGWRYRASLGGPLRLGPPVKPDPNAKPAPPAPPQNVID